MTTNVESVTTSGAGMFGREGDTGAAVAIPLLGVEVRGRIDGGSAEMVMRQRYRNDGARAIEAVYVFPLPADAAVCGFAAEVGGRRVEGRVEAKERAFEVYDDALASGHGAFLLDAERPDIFTLSVGNLKAGAEAIVELRWVTRIHTEGPAWRFVLPTTVSPRYVPTTPVFEVGEPDGDRVNPPKALSVPYGLDFALEIGSAFGRLRRVESPSHALRIDLGESPRVALAQAEVALDRDLVIVIEPEARVPTATVATGPDGERFVQVAFIPDFGDTPEVAGEFVFVVDCSGSMGGDSIQEARRALELCVRALGEGDAFNIVRFGSTYETLFPTARRYDQGAFDAALQCIRATDANLGGTELLAPLEAIFASPGAARRTIVLLTDGQVSNESAVIALAATHAAKNRVFAFGIGAGVSESLVRGLARVTRGEAEFIAPGERVEPKVLRQFGRMRAPVLEDVTVDWGGLAVEQAPKAIPGVFDGQPLVVLARVTGGQAETVVLRSKDKAWQVPVDLERPATGGAVPLMWARAMMTEIEDVPEMRGSQQKRGGMSPEEKRDKALVALGTRFGLVSRATSFVAVELRSDADRTTAEPELVRVPNMLTEGWSGVALTMARAMLAPKMAMRASGIGGQHVDTHMQRQLAASAAPRPPMIEPTGSFDAMPAEPTPAAGGMLKRVARKVADTFGKGEARRGAPPPPAPGGFSRFEAAADEAEISEPADIALEALFALLAGQLADGSFDVSVVQRALDDAGDVARSQRLSAAMEPAKTATELAIELLAERFAEHADLWSPAAKKATRYLAAG